MASSTVATRLPAALLREITRYARRRRMGPSEALRAIVDEWVAMARYPAIEFRDGPVGRRPGVRGGPDVWEIVMVAREAGRIVFSHTHAYSNIYILIIVAYIVSVVYNLYGDLNERL